MEAKTMKNAHNVFIAGLSLHLGNWDPQYTGYVQKPS